MCRLFTCELTWLAQVLPEWSHRYWGLESRQGLTELMPTHLQAKSAAILFGIGKQVHWVEAQDFARVMILWLYGGLVVDVLDTEIVRDVEPLRTVPLLLVQGARSLPDCVGLHQKHSMLVYMFNITQNELHNTIRHKTTRHSTQ